MKTVVLATDFSKNASPAADFALQLAGILNARLVLVHVYHHPLRVHLLRELFTPLERKIKINAQRKLYQLRNKLKKVGGDRVAISVMAREGSTLDTLAAVVTELKADLLIMGTSGENSAGVRYFGSQATEMIPRTPVPLLLVPPGARFATFRNLVVALDLDSAVDAGALDGVLRFANRFEAVLNLLCVTPNPEDPGIRRAAEEIRGLLRHQPHTVSLLRGEELTPALLAFAADNRAELLITLPKPHHNLLAGLLESNTQQLARQSAIPVLALV